jgi:hypothetical protein
LFGTVVIAIIVEQARIPSEHTGEEGKRFFFEKKKQKTYDLKGLTSRRWRPTGGRLPCLPGSWRNLAKPSIAAWEFPASPESSQP